MAIQIYNASKSDSFTIDDISIDIGKVLSAVKDPAIKVGDKIYMSITLEDLKLINPEILLQDQANDYFSQFFTFKSDTNDATLSVKLLKALPTLIDGPVVYELTYTMDLSGLESGEQIVNVIAFFIDPTNEVELIGIPEPETGLLVSSAPFYVHQSLMDNFQSNIANGGISPDRNGLDRNNVGFPTYLPVGLQPVNPLITKDTALWTVIRNGTNALSFRRYSEFMDFLFCGGPNPFSIENEAKFRTKLSDINKQRSLPFNSVDAYRALKVATEAFLMGSMEVFGIPDNSFMAQYHDYLLAVKRASGNNQTEKILPYLALIRQKLPDIDFKSLPFEQTFLDYIDEDEVIRDKRLMETCYGLVSSKLRFPCFIELIWSYWHEESMMVQGLGTIARRFQNIRGEGIVDPLANIEIGPLRPLNNLMWGYIQDEQHRLTVRRRAYEYDHQYGITLQGTAVKGLRPADSRSKFIEAFHTLLNLCIKFYHQYDDTTVVADGFPIMNALKEVHMILSEGAHNQFGDLPSTARIEMLMQQYILARPEFREFLPTRQMVAYPEAWMDRVGVLNQMHSWTKTNVLHFRDLGIFGEQIVLSIRFGAWSDVINRDQAANWAIFWRPQIQNYMHAYRAVTGVDLSREDGAIDAQQPSYHLIRRLTEQNPKLRV